MNRGRGGGGIGGGVVPECDHNNWVWYPCTFSIYPTEQTVELLLCGEGGG